MARNQSRPEPVEVGTRKPRAATTKAATTKAATTKAATTKAATTKAATKSATIQDSKPAKGLKSVQLQAAVAVEDAPKHALPGFKITKSGKPAWTDLTRRQFESYVLDLAKKLKLSDWSISVDWRKAAADDSLAEIDLIYAQKRGSIRLGPRFLYDSVEDQRHTVVHELMHCHLSQMMDLIWSTNEAAFSSRTAKLLEPSFDLMMECTVDALADAMAPLMVLPPWATK